MKCEKVLSWTTSPSTFANLGEKFNLSVSYDRIDKFLWSSFAGSGAFSSSRNLTSVILITNTVMRSQAQDIPSPDCRQKKNRAHHKYKKNIAMTNCLVILYPSWRQSVIAIIIVFVFMVSSAFFSACSPGLVCLGPYSVCSNLPVAFSLFIAVIAISLDRFSG